MKKIFLLLICIGFVFSALAQAKLKDLPDDHWAASAVYDLVRMGVTKGYPDGTYRGNKPITRYETAIFLSKLAKALGGEELKADIKALRKQIVELKNSAKTGMNISGSYDGSWKLGNLLAAGGAGRSGLASYRLLFVASREMGEDAEIRINLDTMDYGFFDDGSSQVAGRGLLATELFDIESNLRLDLSSLNLRNPVYLKIAYGPGPKQHLADPTNAFPSEVGAVYKRPHPSIFAATKILGLDVLGGYLSAQNTTFEASGKVNVGNLTGTIGYTFSRFLIFNSLRVDVTGDYMSRGLYSTSERNIKAKIGLLAALGEKARLGGTVAVAKSSEKMMVTGNLALNDPWDTGTVVTIRTAKIGSQFIDPAFSSQQFYWAGLDNFNRPLENATVNLGGELVQAVSDRIKLTGKGDLRLSSDYKYSGSKARLTLEGGLSHNVAPNVNLDAAYRVFQDKGYGDTTDMAALGLIYRF